MAAPRFHLATPLSVLWRDQGVLQLGLDGEAAVLLSNAPEAADVALRALRMPRTVLELAHLVPGPAAAWLDGLLATLQDAGLVAEVAPTPRTPLVVVGSGVLADAVLDVLAAEGVRVSRPPRGVGVPAEDALVVLASPTVEPDRVLLRDLAASGTPHLVVRAEPERVVVGPFVGAGAGPCVGCTDLVRRDLDPAWSFLLAQLCRTEHTPTRTQTAWAAAMASAHVAGWLAGHRPETVGATLELDAVTGLLGTRRWPAHPDCACALAAA